MNSVPLSSEAFRKAMNMAWEIVTLERAGGFYLKEKRYEFEVFIDANLTIEDQVDAKVMLAHLEQYPFRLDNPNAHIC